MSLKSFKEWLSLREMNPADPDDVDPNTASQMASVIQSTDVNPIKAATGDVNAAKKLMANAARRGIEPGKAAKALTPDPKAAQANMVSKPTAAQGMRKK